MQTAVTEDRALLGSNLSAGDGPKLAGAVHGSQTCAPSLPVSPCPLGCPRADQREAVSPSCF